MPPQVAQAAARSIRQALHRPRPAARAAARRQFQHAIGAARHLGIVRDDDDVAPGYDQASSAGSTSRRWPHRGCPWAHRRGSARAVHQRARDRHALLLAAGELVHRAVRHAAKPEFGERGCGCAPRPLVRVRHSTRAPGARSPGHKRRDEVEELVDEAYARAPVQRAGRLCECGHVRAVDRTEPAPGRSMPLMRFSSVDLPEPLRPVTATTSPGQSSASARRARRGRGTLAEAAGKLPDSQHARPRNGSDGSCHCGNKPCSGTVLRDACR